jgi:hypothetical protein
MTVEEAGRNFFIGSTYQLELKDGTSITIYVDYRDNKSRFVDTFSGKEIDQYLIVPEIAFSKKVKI